MIPYRMVHQLEVPKPPTGLQIDRNESLGEKIVSQTVASVLVDRRRFDRQVRNPGFLIDGNLGPDPVVAGPLPRTTLPGVVPELSRTRNAIEAPQQVATLGVERSDETLGV